jgi:predicted transcriptional regulator
MSEVRLHVTDLDNFFSDAAAAVAGIGDSPESSGTSAIGFESMDLLLKVLTPNRWRLLRALKAHGASSIRKLSATLGRDYRGVHADITALLAAGLIEKASDGLVHVPWDKITVEMAFSEAA